MSKQLTIEELREQFYEIYCDDPCYVGKSLAVQGIMLDTYIVCAKANGILKEIEE